MAYSPAVQAVNTPTGSVVVGGGGAVGQLGEMSSEAAAELAHAAATIEAAVGRAFSYDKINYLMLMMVDPDVHFHVLPRYESVRRFGEQEFADAAWPGPPDITANLLLAEETQTALLEHLRGFF